jgi:hypothetical protein
MSGSANVQADISHVFGSDWDETPDGDIALATGDTLTTQRVIRRLLNMPTTEEASSYPWEPLYGVGLPEDVGSPIDPRGVTGKILAQMRQEANVAVSPPPTVTIDGSNAASGVYPVTVIYYDLTGTKQTFNFDYSP